MKKTLFKFSSLILVMSLVVSLGVFMTGCGNSASGNKQVKVTFWEEDDPGNNEKFLGVSAEFAKKLYRDVLTGYLGKLDEDKFNKIRLLCYIHMIWWNQTNTPEHKGRLEGCRTRLYELLDKYDDVNID